MCTWKRGERVGRGGAPKEGGVKLIRLVLLLLLLVIFRVAAQHHPKTTATFASGVVDKRSKEREGCQRERTSSSKTQIASDSASIDSIPSVLSKARARERERGEREKKILCDLFKRRRERERESSKMKKKKGNLMAPSVMSNHLDHSRPIGNFPVSPSGEVFVFFFLLQSESCWLMLTS